MMHAFDRTPDGDHQHEKSSHPTVRRDGAPPPGLLLGLQRDAGNAAVASMMQDESPVLGVLSAGGGRPLDQSVRAEMEERLGYSFGDVRVHTDTAADESARSVNASAYTVGSNVVFQQGRYDPSSTEGRTLLAHELTHVVQQRNGPVDGTPAGGGIQVSDPGDRFEREAAATAEQVMAQPIPSAGEAAGSVQRQAADELEDVD